MPEEILEKPSALTSAEWRTVVQHPRIGQVILEQAAALKDAVPIILHHHERYAGHGYPFGLRGNDIPLGARIVAIADAYDAMTHDRPYKRAMSHEGAIEELRRHAGTQFDPELVELFCDLYATVKPEPDATVLALTAASSAHHHDHAVAPLIVPDPRAGEGRIGGGARPMRRRSRRSCPTPTPMRIRWRPLTGSGSTTLAADGAIGLAEPLDRHAEVSPGRRADPVPASSGAPSRFRRGLIPPPG